MVLSSGHFEKYRRQTPDFEERYGPGETPEQKVAFRTFPNAKESAEDIFDRIQSLNHPSIRPAKDVIQIDGTPHLRFPQNGLLSLEQAMPFLTPLDVPTILYLGLEVTVALQHASSLGHAHGKLTADYLLLGPSGDVLVDFGVPQETPPSENDGKTLALVLNRALRLANRQKSSSQTVDSSLTNDLEDLAAQMAQQLGRSVATIEDFGKHDVKRLYQRLIKQDALAPTRTLNPERDSRLPATLGPKSSGLEKDSTSGAQVTKTTAKISAPLFPRDRRVPNKHNSGERFWAGALRWFFFGFVLVWLTLHVFLQPS